MTAGRHPAPSQTTRSVNPLEIARLPSFVEPRLQWRIKSQENIPARRGL